MTTGQSALLGIRTSGDYFISTFLFGVMFGIAAAASGIEDWQAMLMSASVFTASGQFAALEFWQAPLPLGTMMNCRPSTMTVDGAPRMAPPAGATQSFSPVALS